MIDPSILRAMQAAGCTTDQILAVVEAVAAKEEERRAKRREQGRERQRRFRARNADNALHDVTERDERYPPSPSPEVSPHTPLPTPTHTPGSITTRARGSGFQPPNGVSFEQFSAFCKQRKKKLTDRAYTLLCKKLKDLEDAGYPPGEMIDLAIERGWETVFEPKEYRSGQRTDTIRGTRPNPALDMWIQAQRDLAASEDPGAGGGTWPALPPGQSG